MAKLSTSKIYSGALVGYLSLVKGTYDGESDVIMQAVLEP